MDTKTCKKCKKVFTRPDDCSDNSWRSRRCCSDSCHSKGIKRFCKKCGKGFYTKMAHIKVGWGEYCSRSCSKKGKIPPNLKIAQAASPIIKKGNPSHLKGKKRKMSDQWYENHKKSNYKRGSKGEKHPNWKGGATPISARLRNTIEYKEWRKGVYKRDMWTCQDCGTHCKAKNIVAHHIKSFNDYPELRHDIDNGITYCRACHASLHQQLKVA